MDMGNISTAEVVYFDTERSAELFAEAGVKSHFWTICRYFISEKFLTYCGIASSVTILNSLGVPSPAAPQIYPYRMFTQDNIFSDEVLRRMQRGVSRAETERLLDRLRERIDRLVLRTILMAGFPGETDEQFEELLDFLRQRRFERLGVFTYSDEPGTPAAELVGQVHEDVRQSRRDRLLAAQQQIAFEWNRGQVGRRLDVLIDRDIPGEENAYVARSYADAPDVDGVVYLTGHGLEPGQIVPCEIVATREYDLIGAAASATTRERSVDEQ